MKQALRVLICIGIALSINSCMPNKKFTMKYQCLIETTMANNISNPEYKNIRRAFSDTLKDWINIKKIRYYEDYPTAFNIKLDTLVFFNDSLNKALLLLQLQRKTNCNCTDDVKLISAEKIGVRWAFYASGNPYFSYIVPKTRPDRYSFAELTEYSVKRLMKDGLAENFNSCDVNSKYITSKWFPDKRFVYHHKFITNQY